MQANHPYTSKAFGLFLRKCDFGSSKESAGKSEVHSTQEVATSRDVKIIKWRLCEKLEKQNRCYLILTWLVAGRNDSILPSLASGTETNTIY